MAFLLRGEYNCDRCECRFEWRVAILDKNVTAQFLPSPICINVKDFKPIDQTNCFRLEIECPNCYRRAFVISEH